MNYKWKNTIGLMFPKELMLRNPMVNASVLFVITGSSLRSILGLSRLMQKAVGFNNAAMVSVKGNYYKIHCGIWVNMKP